MRSIIARIVSVMEAARPFFQEWRTVSFVQKISTFSGFGQSRPFLARHNSIFATLAACILGSFVWPEVSSAQMMAAHPPVAPGPLPPLGLPAGPGSSQDQFQRYRTRQMQLDRLAPPDSSTQFLNSKPDLNQSKRCVRITEIEVKGADHLPSDTLNKIRRFATGGGSGRCLSVADLNTILDRINDAYIKLGLVTSRAYLPQQSLRDEKLQITVIEGVLKKITFEGVSRRHHGFAAFPASVGHVLNLRDLEQGMDQINRLPSWSAQMQIVPGAAPGESQVKIVQDDPGILHGQIWADNNGQFETGRETGHVMLRADDALGLLDLWSVEYDHSLVGDAGSRGTQFISANGSIPFGPWTVFGGWWMSNDVYHIQSLGDDYRLAGRRKDFQIGVSRVVTRNRIGITTLQAGFEQKSFQSTINKVRLETQSARQVMFFAQASESLKALGGVWYVTIGMNFMVDALGTYSAFLQPQAEDPHTDYVKPIIDIDGYRPIGWGLFWHGSLHGEYATRNQFSTQQMQLGGPYSVRGFLSQVLLGNQGLYMRNDVSRVIAPANLGPQCGPYSGFCRLLVAGTELYAIMDFGAAWAGYQSNALPPMLQGGVIAGSGFGLRKTSGAIFWNASASRAIAHGPLRDEGWIALFQAGVRF